jgi:hypothetical protein
VTDEDREFCRRILSSDALAELIVDRLERKIPTSVVRMADGERAILAADQGTWFLRDRRWLAEFGLQGAHLPTVAADLRWAGYAADFLACSISGLHAPEFAAHRFFPRRDNYIDQFFPTLWEATGRTQTVLRATPLLVIHRHWQRIVERLTQRYGLVGASGLPLDSWRDLDRLLREASRHPARLVLVSGGPAGKAFCCRLSQASGQTVLDVGQSLAGIWAR